MRPSIKNQFTSVEDLWCNKYENNHRLTVWCNDFCNVTFLTNEIAVTKLIV